MKKNFSSIKRHTAAAAAAICIAAGAFGLPAHAGEVAFVDVSQVIAQSNPGKTAQKRVDELRAKLNKELENYAKTEKDKGKVEIRQLELNREYNIEHTRVTNLIVERLRKVIDTWLKTNKKGVTAVVSKSNAISVSAKADVTKDILTKFNKEKIDFGK
ncbi:OmpH family outer membrane protein [uncultured Cloacibacillus sp.]|uniref:OmpH family outer membrane protein n=1 Tax=uncultured Cloacibacillus sp. TaxID=889794 RepID=UPI00320882BB